MSKQKITDYKIIQANTIAGMESFINSGITDGWYPLGGVCNDGTTLLQAMVKYEQCEV